MRCGSGSWLSPGEERAEVEGRDRARVAVERLLLEVACLHNASGAAHPAQTSGVDFLARWGESWSQLPPSQA